MRHRAVRAAIWGLGAVALAVAVCWPAADLWHAWHTPVRATIAVVPAHPTAGQTATITVTLTGETAAFAGDAPLVATLEMIGMEMGTWNSETRADQQTAVYRLPVRFTMAGAWQVVLRLELPSHAPWSDQLRLAVAPPDAAP